MGAACLFSYEHTRKFPLDIWAFFKILSIFPIYRVFFFSLKFSLLKYIYQVFWLFICHLASKSLFKKHPLQSTLMAQKFLSDRLRLWITTRHLVAHQRYVFHLFIHVFVFQAWNYNLQYKEHTNRIKPVIFNIINLIYRRVTEFTLICSFLTLSW